MKSLILVLTVSLMSLSALASDCKELVQRLDPDDRIETIYQCKLVSTDVGNPSYSYDKMCFSSAKTWFNHFRDTSYRTYRYSQAGVDDYAQLMIVSQNANGVVRHGSIQQNGPLLTLTDDGHTSGTTLQSWVEQTVVNTQTQQIVFNTYDKGLFKRTLTYSASYQCQQIQ